jgi:hypothetical protein
MIGGERLDRAEPVPVAEVVAPIHLVIRQPIGPYAVVTRPGSW